MSFLALTTTPAPTSSLKRVIADHPLVAYFVLAFAGTWLTVLPVLLSRSGLGVFPFTLPFLPFQLLATFTGPTLAALLVTAASDGRAGVSRLLRRYGQWRVGLPWYLLVLFGYVMIDLLAMTFAAPRTALHAIVQGWPLIFTTYLPAVLTIQLVGPLGEEPGWRGFALPHLQDRYGALRGSLVLGVLHSLWHLPAFFVIGGLGPFSVSGFVVFVLVGILNTILWTWVFNNTQGSILIAILLHDASTASLAVLLPGLYPVVPPAAVAWVLGLYLVSTLLVVVCTKGRLAYRRNRQAQPADAVQPREMTPNQAGR